MNTRRRKKGNIPTRRLSFNKSLPETPERSVRKLTPGNKKKKTDEANEAETELNLSEILSKRWKLFRVSPMHNFQASKIKTYSRKLREQLAWLTNKSGYEAVFTIKSDLKPFQEGTDGIQVEILLNNKIIFIGYFLSWAIDVEDKPNSMQLPILLVQSTAQVQVQVHKILSKFFDCDIQPVKLTSFDLITYFVGLLLIPRSEIFDMASAVLSLLYHIPGSPPKDSITVSFSMAEISFICTKIASELAGMDHEEIIFSVYRKILNHIYNVYQVDFSVAKLFKIVFEDVAISSEGLVHWHSNEAANATLDVMHKLISQRQLICSRHRRPSCSD